MALRVKASPAEGGARPGQEVAVTPSVGTPGGLELIDCRVADPADEEGRMAEADVRLTGPGGVADRTASSFL